MVSVHQFVYSVKGPVMALSGRLAVVTGGGSGIGKSTCRTLALEGASILVADINLEAAVQVANNLPGEEYF